VAGSGITITAAAAAAASSSRRSSSVVVPVTALDAIRHAVVVEALK
jgi:hypothetical protein